jgi:hypothetical protein
VSTAPQEGAAPIHGAPEVVYDRGYIDEERKFLPATNCVKVPCIIGPNGVIKFPWGISDGFDLRFGYFHDGVFRPLGIIESVAEDEDTMARRLLNQHKNFHVLNLERALENGKHDAIYLYGIGLRYPILDGDLFVVTIESSKDRSLDAQYYFRFSRKGAVKDIDISVVIPMPTFTPNPNGIIRGAQTSVAVSYTVGWHLDPERSYNSFETFARAWKFNAVAGILSRNELTREGPGDTAIEQKADGFIGVGVTFIDFLSVGYGINLVRVPRSGFPYVGIQVKHFYDVMHSFISKNRRWKDFLADERKRAR